MKAVLVYRAPQFSPNSVKKDQAILEAVGEELRQRGAQVSYVQEEDLLDDCDADVYLTMSRLPETLALLRHKEEQGRVVVNSTRGIEVMQLPRAFTTCSLPLHGTTWNASLDTSTNEALTTCSLWNTSMATW